MHALTIIPYDMIHMYAQELIRAKSLKEWQTLLCFFIGINNNFYYSHTDWYIKLLFTYISADIQACHILGKYI